MGSKGAGLWSPPCSVGVCACQSPWKNERLDFSSQERKPSRTGVRYRLSPGRRFKSPSVGNGTSFPCTETSRGATGDAGAESKAWAQLGTAGWRGSCKAAAFAGVWFGHRSPTSRPSGADLRLQPSRLVCRGAKWTRSFVVFCKR